MMMGMPNDGANGAATQVNATLQLLVQAINSQTQKAALIPYSTASSAGAASGLYLNVTVDGANYKIALLLP